MCKLDRVGERFDVRREVQRQAFGVMRGDENLNRRR